VQNPPLHSEHVRETATNSYLTPVLITSISLLATGLAVNKSLVCVVLACAMFSNVLVFGSDPNRTRLRIDPRAASVSNSTGPSAVFFAAGEPYGLFDELLDRLPGRGETSQREVRSKKRDVGLSPKPVATRSLLRSYRDLVIRANYDVDSTPPTRPFQSPSSVPSTYATQSIELGEPYDPSPQTPGDASPPFVPSPLNVSPYGTVLPPPMMPGPSWGWGANGPQPYRLGHTPWGNMAWLSSERTSIDNSRFDVFELNLGLNHTTPTGSSPWLFSVEHEFGYRSWEGPATIDLPGGVYHFGWDMRLETPLNSPLSPFAFTLAFNPSINSDFDQSLGRQAINLDARGIMYIQADPRLMFAFGAGFWDRVKDRVIPYVGLVWTPDDRWEFRLMFPQSRISYFLGNVMGVEDVWLYASGEYHIESYQIGTTEVAAGQDQIELQDWRALIGVRKCTPWVSGFFEAGWVFDRNVTMRVGPDFDISSGFIGRVGISF
jgi:hypothetical protein